MTRMIVASAAILSLLASGQALAFQKLPDGTTVQERAHTAKLNAEQLAKANAETTAYEQQVATVAREKAEIERKDAADQAEYARQTAAYEAEKERVARVAAEERQKWEADVAACKAGEVSRCAQPTPKN